MSKYVRKYRKGGKITSLEELYKQDFIYVFDKITHRGWFGSWQIRFAQQCINRGVLFYARKVDTVVLTKKEYNDMKNHIRECERLLSRWRI